MSIEAFVRRSIVSDKRKLKRYRGVVGKYSGLSLMCRTRRKTGKPEYYCKDHESGKQHYLGLKDCDLIIALQKKEVYLRLIDVIQHNIRCKERFCEALLPDDENVIRELLPKAFQPNPAIEKAAMRTSEKSNKHSVRQSENPINRDELKIKTSFGLFVRTKGEMAIAELLYSLGIDFAYEKAISLYVERKDRYGNPYWTYVTRYPDFTIRIGDGTYVYWEHKGMLSKMGYTKSDIQREIDYNMNGIFQTHNLIVTAEGPNNEMDMDGIQRIVDGWLIPLL